MNINKFTQKSMQAVQDCEKVAMEYGNQEIAQEHLFYALLRQEDGLISKMMEIRNSEDDGKTVANVLCVVLQPEDTVDLVGKFIYQISIKDSSGEIEIPDQGIIRISNNINKNFSRQATR